MQKVANLPGRVKNFVRYFPLTNLKTMDLKFKHGDNFKFFNASSHDQYRPSSSLPKWHPEVYNQLPVYRAHTGKPVVWLGEISQKNWP